jgi:hypothetical protein
MVSGHIKIWAGLVMAGSVLTATRLFVPLPETWDKIFGGAAILLWLGCSATFFWEDWRKRTGRSVEKRRDLLQRFDLTKKRLVVGETLLQIDHPPIWTAG